MPLGPAATPPRVRARFWTLLAVALLLGLAVYPPVWHAGLRALLVWEAGRQGCDLSVDAIEGGPFDTTHLYGVHCRQRGLPSTPASGSPLASGTDLRVAHAEIALAWTPFTRPPQPASSWVQRLVLDGVRGRWDLSAMTGHHANAASSGHPTWFDGLAARLVPADFLLHADDAALHRGRYCLRVRELSLSGSRLGEGGFLARSMEVSGPRFDATLPDLHGRALWLGDRLTFSDVNLGNGVRLDRATLDGTRLARRRLDWDCDLRALGGTIRGQGAVNFARERLALEVGGSVQAVMLGPLARIMEIPGPADGRVEQASFSVRGDPENWPAADMWLSGRATDFRWGQRRWESLEMQTVVTNRRVQVHRLELRQSRNRLSLAGECSLPPDPQAAGGNRETGRWWQAGFACNVDARLEDLHDLAQLFGPPVPDLAGRMSVNGRLSASPGSQGFDGYLNVEGSRLSIHGAPLDYLRSTLIFRGEELQVADLQATRGGDYLAGHGSLRIAGPTDFQALGRVSVDNLGVYSPAYAGLLPWLDGADGAPIRSLTAGVRLEGSVLHLDQCRGEQSGNTFDLGGSVDLRDPAAPVLDLTLNGEDPARMADPADSDAAWRAGVAYDLALRGALLSGPTIHGETQLLHGHFDAAVGVWPERIVTGSEFDVATSPPLAPSSLDGVELLRPLLRRLPVAWLDWPLDLHVTAATPMPDDGLGTTGEVTPDLNITGTARHPQVTGKLAFTSEMGPESESGAWYFSPGAPENPVASITSTANGLRGTFFYGPRDAIHAVSWGTDPSGSELFLQPPDGLPRFTPDDELLELWLPKSHSPESLLIE